MDQSLCVIPESKSIMMERDHKAALDALSNDESSKVWWLKDTPKGLRRRMLQYQLDQVVIGRKV